MKLLLDTHVFLWMLTEPERLGQYLGTVKSQRTELLVSAASSWEIAIQYGLGRLDLPEPPERYVPERIRLLGATGVPIEHSHALSVGALPPLHRDPFDRLLIAQAIAMRTKILTADPAIVQYPVDALLIDV